MKKTGILISLFLIVVMISSCGKLKRHSDVLAMVNGEAITVEDFQEQLEEISPTYRDSLNDLIAKRKLLDGMVKERLLLQEAKKAGLHRDKKIYNQLQKIKKQMLIREVLKTNIENNLKITDKDIKAYYELHKEIFDRMFKGKRMEDVKKDVAQFYLREREEQAIEGFIYKIEKGAKIDIKMDTLKTVKVTKDNSTKN